MRFYSQKWYDEPLGTCTNTIKTDGCFVVCLSMLAEIDPPTANKMLREGGGYWAGCMMLSAKAAAILGLDYKPTVYKDPGVLCIAETNYYKDKGFGQHFFIYENGKRVDPLDNDPKWEKNTYPIVSYRLFSKPKTNMAKIYDIKSVLDDELKHRNKNFKDEDGDWHVKMAKILKKERKDLEASQLAFSKLETELKECMLSDDSKYKLINEFDLGIWRIKISSKESEVDDKTS